MLGPLADGEYAFRVRATDRAGNIGEQTGAAFTVDGTPPAAPTVVAASANAHRVTITGTAEPGATILLSEGGPPVPGEDIVAAADGKWATLLQGVPDGSHGYVATATDAAGNQSARSQPRVVTVDTVAPVAALVSIPTGVVTTNAPAATFSANEAATFECRLTGPWLPCASPLRLGPLVDSRYTLWIRATDLAGNTSAELASAEFTVDTTAPVATIGADGVASSEPGATLQCRLDGGAWAACARAYSGGDPGEHVVEARATDAAGNVGPVATHAWTIARPPVFTPGPNWPPDFVLIPQKLTLTVARQSLTTVLKRGLTVSLRCARTCRASLVVTQGKKRLARKSAPGGKVTLKLPAATRRALARTKRVTFTVTVSAVDAAAVKRKVTLKRWGR
jgi:hypothetical protein